jgi:hypothetical protein
MVKIMASDFGEISMKEGFRADPMAFGKDKIKVHYNLNLFMKHNSKAGYCMMVFLTVQAGNEFSENKELQAILI